MSEDNKLPFEPAMCLNQFEHTLGFVEAMQGDPRIEDACAEAERRCTELFDEFYASGDRIAFMMMLGYLAMDVAANVAYTLDRAKLWIEVDE